MTTFVPSLQPVRETREKQVQLWKELILDYCRSQKMYIISLEEDFPLFSNPKIESKSYLSEPCVLTTTLLQFSKNMSYCVESVIT